MITFIAWGAPVAQPRHRARVLKGKPCLYLPASAKVHGFKRGILKAFGENPKLDGPVRVSIIAMFPRPKSMVRKRTKMPSYLHVAKPDGDNIAKAVLDALNGVAWSDDSQVSYLRIRKVVCGGGELPCCYVQIERDELNEDSDW